MNSRDRDLMDAQAHERAAEEANRLAIEALNRGDYKTFTEFAVQERQLTQQKERLEKRAKGK